MRAVPQRALFQKLPRSHSSVQRTTTMHHERSKRVQTISAAAFVLSVCVYVVSGLLCVINFPRTSRTVCGVPIPSDTHCFSIVRHADHVLMEVPIGSPPRLVKILFRMGDVVDNEVESFHLFEQRLVESKSLVCTSASNHTCSDAFLVAMGGPETHLSRVVYQFRYDLPSGVPAWLDARALGAEGEFFAVRNLAYFLTDTHLCVARTHTVALPKEDEERNSSVLHARIDDAATTHDYDDIRRYTLTTTGANVSSVDLPSVRDSAVHIAVMRNRCNRHTTRVALFPSEASNENNYLAISDPYVYEVEPDRVRLRRLITEIGYLCADDLHTGVDIALFAPFDAMEVRSAIRLYEFDSRRLTAEPWRQEPTLPYRRVASATIVLAYGSDTVTVRLEHNAALLQIPRLVSETASVSMAILKLFTLFLAAAVVWIRSGRNTSSATWLYVHCLETIDCANEAHPKATLNHLKNEELLEDAVWGVLSLLSRIVLCVVRFSELSEDNQARVCIVNAMGGGASFVNWLARFFLIDPNILQLLGSQERVDDASTSDPLARLGGSMALVDVTCAVLLAFAQPPIMDALTTFDDTARVLTGLLISLVAMHRCVVANTCIFYCYAAHHTSMVRWDVEFVYLLLASAVLWPVQIVAAAVSLVDLAVVPLSVSVTRAVVGEDGLVGVVFFLAGVCLAIPRLLETSMEVFARHSRRHTSRQFL